MEDGVGRDRMPTEKLVASNRAFRSVIAAFYKAEAARRGLDV